MNDDGNHIIVNHDEDTDHTDSVNSPASSTNANTTDAEPIVADGLQIVRKSRRYISTVALSGVTAALVFAATLLSIPAGTGTLNMGDGMILLIAYVMGPIALFPASIGAALADFFLGYTIYIPATFVIKAVMGFVAGLIMYRGEPSIPRKAMAFIVAELIMVGGYFLYEWLILGLETATVQAPANLVQGSVAIAVAFVLTLAFKGIRNRVRLGFRKVSHLNQ